MREERKEVEDVYKSVKDLVIICFEISKPIMSKFIMKNTLESRIIEYIPD